MKKLLLTFSFLIITQTLFSQIFYSYKIHYIELEGINYSMPSEAMKFIDNTEMEQSLKANLTNQYNKMMRKRKTSKIIAYSGVVTGMGYAFVKGSQGEGKNKQKEMFRGFGFSAVFIIASGIIAPNLKDYKKFVNTYNSNKKSKKELKTNFTFNFLEDKPAIGICFTF